MYKRGGKVSDRGTTGSRNRLAATGVHLEMRVALQQILDGNERTLGAKSQAVFSAAVGTRLPGRSNQRGERLRANALAERTPQIDPAGRIEAEVPHTVSRQS